MTLRRRARLLSLEVGLEFLDLEIDLISYQSSKAAVLHYIHHLKSGGAKYVPKQDKYSGRRSVPETRLPWFICSKIRDSLFREEKKKNGISWVEAFYISGLLPFSPECSSRLIRCQCGVLALNLAE